MRLRVGLSLMVAAIAVGIAACGGGGGSSSSGGGIPVTTQPSATPVQSPVTSSTSAPLSTSSSTTVNLPTIQAGYSGSITFPAVSSSSTANVTLQSTVPGSYAVPSLRNLKSRFTLGAQVTTLAYLGVTVSSQVTLNQLGVSATFPTSVGGADAYVAFFDPKSGNGWQAILGPVTPNGPTLTFPLTTLTPSITLQPGTTYAFAIVTNGSPLPSSSPSSSPTASPTSSSSAVPLAGPTGPAWTPTDVANALGFPVQQGYNGAGQTAAIIIDDDPTVDADILNYLTYNQTPSTGRSITPVHVLPTSSPAVGTDALEGDLDLETIAGLAPGANIIVYEMPDLSDQSIIAAVTKAVSDNTAGVVSMSFGGCEYSNAATTTEQTQFANGVKQGQAFFASSGDQGNECYSGATPNPYQPGVSYPASDPNVIGVGGTETWQPTNYKLTSTKAWNDLNFGSGGNTQGASGGGVSTLFTLPTFQQTSYVTSTAASTTMRNVPDIAMPAEYTLLYTGGMTREVGIGTSWSSPLAAVAMAEVYQYCNLPSASVNPLTLLYSQAGQAASYIDVTTGTNEYAGTTPYNSAGPGFDNVSGLGVLQPWAFAQAACPNRTPAAAARRIVAQSSIASSAAAQDVTLNAPALVHRLSDRGRRPLESMTTIVVAVRPSASVASNESAAIAQLQSAGFTIGERFGNHSVIFASAPSGTVERFFSAEMHNYAQDASDRYAPSSTLTIPASLAPYVSGAVLDNLIVAKPANESPLSLLRL